MYEKPLISFDYAIKYLLKHKGDYEIIEGFLSALLATEGYGPVKINAFLESESNRESSTLKKSIADLVVEDVDGNKYLVEIERSFSNNFMHKACFNTSRMVVDNVRGNQDYTTIKKVFHISLLYFSNKQMPHSIYHGKTVIHEVKHSPVSMRIMGKDRELFECDNIFPEYFFIFVPRFDERIEGEIDEWLYVMKHCDVPAAYRAPAMEKVRERLNVLRMDDEERAAYFIYGKEAAHSQDILVAAEEKGREKGIKEGIEKGIKEGIEQGKLEEKIAIALEMLRQGAAVNFVQKVTNLPLEIIEKLQGNNLNPTGF